MLSLFWLGLLLLTACGDLTATPTPAIQNAAQPTATTLPAQTAAPTANLTPAPTLANTTNLASTAIADCRTKDLEVKANWDYSDNFRDNVVANQIAGAVSFTNHGTSPCNLPNAPQFSIIDSKNRPITLKQVTAPAQEAKIQPSQTLFVALSITNCSKFFDISSKDTITLKMILDNELNFSITSIAVAEALPECKYTLQVGPFEAVAGKAFTATAQATEATARSQYLTANSITASYQTAHPPTPTPSPTAIPTIVPNAEPCNAKDLTFKQASRNGGGGHEFIWWYLINNGTTVCTLKGYPKIHLIDDKGQTIKISDIGHMNLSKPASTAVPEADTPLVGVLPGEAAIVETQGYRCDGQSEKTLIKANLVLPNEQGEIFLYATNRCLEPEHIDPTGVSAFEYAPGNWREQP